MNKTKELIRKSNNVELNQMIEAIGNEINFKNTEIKLLKTVLNHLLDELIRRDITR